MIKSVIILKILNYNYDQPLSIHPRHDGNISTQTNSRILIFNRSVEQDLKIDSFVNS